MTTKPRRTNHQKENAKAKPRRYAGQAKQASAKVSRLFYRVREVAEALGMGQRTVWDGVYSGTIPSRKVGDVRLIPAAWVERGSSLYAPNLGGLASLEAIR